VQADVQAATASTVDPALARVLARLAEAAELLGVAEVRDLAAEVTGRLQALRLEVAVVGEFKRGKSSLLNALVGREVLPVGVLPLTAVPTVIEQGEEALVVDTPTAAKSSTRFVSWPASSPRRPTQATAWA